MSNNTEQRTVDTIHKEYSELCARAGHVAYQVEVLSADLKLIYEQLKTLNLEAASVKAKEGEAK